MNKGVWLVIAAGCSLGAPLALAQSSATPETSATSGVSARASNPRAETMRQLARPLTLDLTNARLEDVIQFVRDYSGARIDVYWADDDTGAGLDKEKQINITTRDTPVLSVIERILTKASDDYEQAGWQFTEDGAIEIGPKSRLNQSKTLKAYDIQDLLFVIPDYSQVPELDVDSVLQGNQGGGGGGGSGSIIRDQQNQQPGQNQQSDQEAAQRIIDIIIENVEPEQWQDNGGDGASVRFYNGTLLIRAPDYIHRQLEPEAFMRARGGKSSATPNSRPITNATPGAVEPKQREVAKDQKPVPKKPDAKK